LSQKGAFSDGNAEFIPHNSEIRSFGGLKSVVFGIAAAQGSFEGKPVVLMARKTGGRRGNRRDRNDAGMRGPEKSRAVFLPG